MLAEILAWGFIAAVYLAAVGVIALPKHWYRLAQFLFALATVLADLKIIHWAITSSHSLKMRMFWSSAGLLATTGAVVWFVRKVEGDIRKSDTGTAKRDFLVERLTDFLREADRSWESSGKFREFAMQSRFLEIGLSRKIEKFLEIHLPNEVERFKGKGIDGVDEIIKELLDGERIKTKLTISFDENDPGCVSVQHDKSVTQYRVKVFSPVDISGVELVANYLTLLDFPFIDFHLRPMNDRDKTSGTKRVHMRGGKWYYWDLISVFSAEVMQHGEASAAFDFIPALGSIKAIPGFYEFELMASGENSSLTTKIAKVTIRNNGNVGISLTEGRLSPTS
jgi:hypothetical protein